MATYNMISRMLLLTFLGAVVIHTANGQALTTKDKLSFLKTTTITLRNGVWNFWLKHGADRPDFGAITTLNREGQAVDPTDKFIIPQGKHLWAFASLYELGIKTTQRRNFVGSLYTLLSTKFIDTSDNSSFVSKISKDGAVLDKTKSFWHNTYTINGLARYSRAVSSQAAYDLALKSFKYWDSLLHDSTNKGWFDAVGENKKTQRTTLHIVEAAMELYLTKPSDTFIRSRLAEGVDVLVNKILLSSKAKEYSRFTFDGAWTPIGDENCDAGHELSTIFTLLAMKDKVVAGGVITAKQGEELVTRVETNAKFVLSKGWDATNSGFWGSLGPEGTASATEKEWWHQAEGMLATYQLWRATGKVEYLDLTVNVVKFIWDYQRDAEYGEWYWAVDAVTKKPTNTMKGGEWKATHHTGRSTLLMAAWTNGKPNAY